MAGMFREGRKEGEWPFLKHRKGEKSIFPGRGKKSPGAFGGERGGGKRGVLGSLYSL